jgi:hypothetical protein
MAKDTSFAAKVAKAAAGKQGGKCPTCGEIYEVVKMVVSEKSEAKNSWKFAQSFVQVCNCNKKEIFG